MSVPREKIEVSLNALLYVIKQLGGRGDFHKIFKILYFADQKHLVRFGASISEDYYIAMENGPVPSLAYDILKSVRGDGLFSCHHIDFSSQLKIVRRYEVEALVEPDLEYLSESELRMLDESIDENAGLSFDQLYHKSHDSAYHRSLRDSEIHKLDIAKAGGASEDMLRYIIDTSEIQLANLE